MKRILLVLFVFISNLAFAQQSEGTITGYVDTEIRKKPTLPARTADAFDVLNVSKVSLVGSYANPSWITSLAGSKITGSISGTIPWSSVTSTPTTISGYGISDGVSTGGSYSNPSWITSLAWSKISSTPTTVSGYGITNALVNGANNTITSPTTFTIGSASILMQTGEIYFSGSTYFGGKILFLGGNFTTNGPDAIDFATTGSTALTLPTTGTLATLAGTETFTNKSLTSPTLTGTPIAPTASGGTNTTQIATTAHVFANYQAKDVDLTTIAGLTPSNNDFMQYKSGAWANRTIAQVKTDLGVPTSFSAYLQSGVTNTMTGNTYFIAGDSSVTSFSKFTYGPGTASIKSSSYDGSIWSKIEIDSSGTYVTNVNSLFGFVNPNDTTLTAMIDVSNISSTYSYTIPDGGGTFVTSNTIADYTSSLFGSGNATVFNSTTFDWGGAMNADVTINGGDTYVVNLGIAAPGGKLGGLVINTLGFGLTSASDMIFAGTGSAAFTVSVPGQIGFGGSLFQFSSTSGPVIIGGFTSALELAGNFSAGKSLWVLINGGSFQFNVGTGDDVSIDARGIDDDIDLTLSTKGDGVFKLTQASGTIVLPADLPVADGYSLVGNMDGTTEWANISGGGGSVPSPTTGDAGKQLRVNLAETGYELFSPNLDPTTTNEDLIVRRSGALSRLAVGSNTNSLQVVAGVVTWAGNAASVTLTQPAAGITLTNSGSTQTGAVTSTVALANDLSALEGLSSTGIAVRTTTDTWAQRTITGTSNVIDVTNGNGVSGNPTLTISATYVGQTSITTLGTITTGTWTGTDVAFANIAQIAGLSVAGVTGASTADLAAITGTADQVLRVNGAGTALTFGSLDLTKSATVGVSILGNANGGTGFATYAVGDLLYASTTSALSKLADVTVGSYLRSGGANTAPLWSTLVLPNAATANQVVYASSTNTYGASANFTYNGTTLTVQAVSTSAGIANNTANGTNNGFTSTRTGTYTGNSVVVGMQVTGSSTLRATASDVMYLEQMNNTITTGSTGQGVNGISMTPTWTINHTTATIRGIIYNPTVNGTQTASSHYGLVIASGQSVFGATAPTNNTAVLVDMISTTQGFSPPKMTTTQVNAITGFDGLFAYDVTLHTLKYHNGTSWGAVGIGGSTGSTDKAILIANGTGGVTAQASALGIDASGNLLDANANELIKFTATASAVNEITIANNTTGNSPTISATGGDTNISIRLVGKGNGGVAVATNGSTWTFTGTGLSTAGNADFTANLLATFGGGTGATLFTGDQSTVTSGDITITTGNVAGGAGNSGNINLTTGTSAGGTKGKIIANAVFRLKGYTVATLPAGTVGDTAYVTDALTPTFLTTVVGGGAVVTPVFYNGANWVAH